jgi:hypothetical protein
VASAWNSTGRPLARAPRPLRAGRRRVVPLGAVALACLVASVVLSGARGEDPAETAGRGTHDGDGAASAADRLAGDLARVKVTKRRRQRIEGWGISVTGGPSQPLLNPAGLSGSEVRRLDRLIFRKQGIDLVRVFGPGPQEGPGEVSVWSRSDLTLRFMRRVRRYGVRFAFTGGGAPRSMRQGDSNAGALEPGLEEAYAGFLARNLKAARRAGAPFRWAGIGNETDIPGAFWVSMQASQAAIVYRELAAKIRRQRLGVRLMLGDNEGWAETYAYARRALASRRVRGLSTVVATHPYSDAVPHHMRRLAGFAHKRDLSLWMTEWSVGCPTCPDTSAIRPALRWAEQISYDLRVGQVRTWFVFPGVAPSTHGPNGAIVVVPADGSPLYATKRFPLIRQFTSAASPGARVYKTLVSDPALQAVAFRRNHRTTLVVTNHAARSRSAALDLSRHRGLLRSRRTSQDENFRRLRSHRYRGRPLRVRLPPLSVTTFRLVRR